MEDGLNNKYRSYLNSPEWQAKKQQLLERSRKAAGSNNMFGVCERCGYKPWKPCLQVHHTTYDHIYNEPLEDLILLCPRCHYEETMTQRKRKMGLPVFEK